MRKSLCVLAMLLLLAGAATLDQLYQTYPARFHSQAPFWFDIGAVVILGALCFLLAWFTLQSTPRSRLVALVFIVAGITGLFSATTSDFTHRWGPLLTGPSPVYGWLEESIASPLALARGCSLMVLAIGLARLLPEGMIRRKTGC
jgi:hypothetical protein